MLRFAALSVFLWLLPGLAAAAIRHDLQVVVEPGVRSVEVVDTIDLPVSASGSYEFLLNESFSIEKVEGGRVTVLERQSPVPELRQDRPFEFDGMVPPRPPEGVAMRAESASLARYEDVPHGTTIYRLDAQGQRVTLRYRARLGQLVNDAAGIVVAYPEDRRVADGIFLDPGAAWYPVFALADSGLLFTMTVTLPEEWSAISQGALRSSATEKGRKQVVWQETQPQQGIFLVAGRYTSYGESARAYQSQVFLRKPDEALANDYLALTHQYITLYERLIGAYPYSKFALVESFWESGFAMPSFTFIGPSVLRLPFIRTTSYPHEILHNWWGNSVYVDYSSGNWSEGLTSYLADHLFDELRGEGANHRRELLQKYTDFIRQDNDFSLAQFTSSQEAHGQAVGYGKALMLFHMLRQRMGDEKFTEALRLLYREYRFRTASYVDIERIFSRVHGSSLALFFDQWVRRTGAPELAIADVARKQQGQGWRVEGVLKQQQLDSPYQLDVPVAVTLEGEPTARYFTVATGSRQQRFSIDLPARPLRIDIDPEFDLFRRLSIDETPPALSQSFGAGRMVLVMAERASSDLRRAWRQLASDWGMEIRSDSELRQLPADRAVWLLGWDNRLLEQLRPSFDSYGVTVTSREVALEGREYQAGRDSLVLALHNPDQPQQAVVWFATTASDAVARYGQRLPHYRKYGYLAFDRKHNNVVKGQWPLVKSPLSVALERGAERALVLPVREPLARP